MVVVDDLNHKLKPIYLAMQYLTTRENVRIARLNSQIDSYFVEAHFFLKKCTSFTRNCGCTISKREDVKNSVDSSLKPLQDFQSAIFKFWDQCMAQETASNSAMIEVLFGDVLASTVTTTTEGKPSFNPREGRSATISLHVDSCAHTSPIVNRRKAVEELLTSGSSVSISGNRCFENDFPDQQF